MAYKQRSPIIVSEGGTGAETLTEHGIVLGQDTAALTTVAVGMANTVLLGNTGADPGWSTATYLATTAQGDLLYSSADNVISSLAKDANATRYISNTGGSNNPAWAQIELTNGVTGILPVGNGGTGIANPADHSLLVGSGAGAMTELGVALDGQLVIGSSAADPVVGDLTSLGGTITIAAGAGTLNIETDGSIATSYLTDDANSAVPAARVLTVAGGANIYTSSAVSTVTIAVNGTTEHAVQIGNATGSLTSLAVGATNQVLLGNTTADPSWGTVGNAALTNSSVTLNNGNNITVTGSPLSLGGTASFDLTGCTQYALQVGDATGSLDSLAVGTANQVMQSGGAGANPAWSTATYPATTSQGDVIYSSADNTVAGLAKDANATRYLSNTGASNNPAWAQVNVTNGVTGTIGVANGGTGVSNPTDHSLLVGSGAAAMTELGVATDGQLIIGSSAADPVLATLTAGSGVSVTNAAGSITVATEQAGMSWSVVTTGQTAADSTGYFCNNAGGVTVTLPATASVGHTFEVCAMNAGGWTIAQNAGQQIFIGDDSTTAGAGGSLASTGIGDWVTLVCNVADTSWFCKTEQGNITVT